MVTLLNCEYHNFKYCFCDFTFANVAIEKYIPLKIANLAIVKYIPLNIANFLILYNLQLITQQMSSFMSFVNNCVTYFALLVNPVTFHKKIPWKVAGLTSKFCYLFVVSRTCHLHRTPSVGAIFAVNGKSDKLTR